MRPAKVRCLTRAQLPSDTITLARYLLGKIVVRDWGTEQASGRIVETEAYNIGDPAGHAYRGMTPRNRSLFLDRGYAYVYLAYGTSLMLNVSSEKAGIGGGVLIRALEPLTGIEIMERRRGTTKRRDLTRGPGRLAAALDIDRRLDGDDLCAEGPLWLGSDGERVKTIRASRRIGISRAAHRLLRFYVADNPFVSGAARLNRPPTRRAP
jgi:DNA-3-methyladenine glycosylase